MFCPPHKLSTVLVTVAVASSMGTAHAGGAILPDVTPRTTSDFRLAAKVTDALSEALIAHGVAVIGPDEVRRRLGPDAAGCAEDPGCVDRLFDNFGGSDVALVGSVGWSGGEADIDLRIYGPGGGPAVREVHRQVPERAIEEFAVHAALVVAELAPAGPEAADDAAGFATEPDEAVPPGEAGAVATRTPAEGGRDRFPALDRSSRAATTHDARSLEDRAEAGASTPAELGVPRKAFERYQQTDASPAEWREEARVRTGHTLVELHVGADFGDVDRRYDTRVAVDQTPDGTFDQRAVFEQDTFLQSTAVALGASVGHVPVWWLEGSIYGGIVLAHKQLTTGWEQYVDGSLYASDSKIYPPASAVVGVLEPRARVYVAATGPVKPYGLAGITLRFYDGYQVPDLQNVDYPNRPGGVAFGPMLGGGLAFDTSSHLTGFVEVPWTRVLVPTPFRHTENGISQVPDPVNGSGQILGMEAGLGMRFR